MVVIVVVLEKQASARKESLLDTLPHPSRYRGEKPGGGSTVSGGAPLLRSIQFNSRRDPALTSWLPYSTGM